MKKRLVCFGLALAFSLSSFSAISFAEGSWKKGWTGKADAAAYTVNANGSTVTMSNDNVNNGKFTDGEDSIVYYANELKADENFELKATVNILIIQQKTVAILSRVLLVLVCLTLFITKLMIRHMMTVFS